MTDAEKSVVEQYEKYGKELLVYHEHPEYGELQGHCDRCGGPRYEHVQGRMCPDCIRETAGTDECPTCREHDEGVCGYHATCLWYCIDCGMVRRIGNQPARPDSDRTVHCPLDPSKVFEESQHTMVRLVYECLAGENLKRYHKQQTKRWNEHTHRNFSGGATPQVVE